MFNNYLKTVGFVLISMVLFSCSTKSHLSKTANDLISKEGLKNAHIGIKVYDPSSKKNLYSLNESKFFVPASNTKLFSLYAGLKYLGDSLVAAKINETSDTIYLQPTGDPTLLHSDFKNHPLFNKLKTTIKPIVFNDSNWKDQPYGVGWAWDDYNSYYMAERSPFPIYGNIIKWTQVMEKKANLTGDTLDDILVYSDPEVDWKVKFSPLKEKEFSVKRDRYENKFVISEGKENLKTEEVPFITNGSLSALELIKDTLGKEIKYSEQYSSISSFSLIFSQPTDSMLKPMMYRSDNFYAEQTLLMASDKFLGRIDAEKMVDTILNGPLKDIPQRPKWVDGSGLSRYNLFSPNDFVYLLEKMQTEFGEKRVKNILPTGNTGTLRNYYKELNGKIFAKTGTLGGQVALSGYLETKKGKNLIFSILVNNHQAGTTAVRRAVEEFLMKVYHSY